MKVHTRIMGLMFSFCLVSLSACGAGTAAKPTVDTVPVYTQLASTALALQTQTVLAKPTATSTPVIPPTAKPSNTPLITATPLPVTPSVTPQASPLPPTLAQAACDNMSGNADVTIQDGYVATPGEVMDKTWSIKNLGPCTWNKNYALAYAYGGDGTNWANTQPVNLQGDVKPGESVEITVVLTAPTKSGTYGAYFRMRNGKDFYFGSVVWILIQVK